MARQQPFFQVGGNLDADAPSYVERPADNEILQALERGELCLVLAPRQTGKSSLMVHTRARLIEKGVQAGVVDLQPLGSIKDPEEWFNDVVYQIEDSFELETDSPKWWEENHRIGPMQRFMKFLEQVVLGEIKGNAVLFIDEIDSALNLPFADDFFTTLRSFYNSRSTKPDLKRLSFVLLGVATASEFIKKRNRTPFNIGTSIQLTDFTPDKIKGFQKVLGADSEELIDRIFYWTEGQPFLVQTLAAAAYNMPEKERTAKQIDTEVENKFFKGKIEQDTHLKFIQDYLLEDRSTLRKTLKTYNQTLQGHPITRDKQSKAQNRLILAGVTTVKDETLKTRNRIYSRVFDQKWVKEHTPGDIYRITTYAASIALLVALAWIFLIQPLFFPRFPKVDKIVRYSSDPSVEISIPLFDTNVSKILLKRKDNNQTEEVFNANKTLVLSQKENIGHTIASMEKGEFIHTLELVAGWQNKTRTIDVEAVHYPNWLVKQIPDARLQELNPIVEVYASKILFRDVMNKRELGVIDDFQSPITASVVSNNRKRLLVGMENGQIRLWDVTVVDFVYIINDEYGNDRKVETKLLQTFTSHEKAVFCLAFSPDGRTIISGSSDQTAKLWDVQTGNVLHSFAGHSSVVSAAAISLDGKVLFTGSKDKSIKQWDMLTGRELRNFDGHNDTVTTLAVSNDGKLLISGSADHLLKLWDIAGSRLINTLEGHKGSITATAILNDGKKIIAGDEIGILKMWDIATSKEIRSYQSLNNTIQSAGFFSQGQLVFAQSELHDLKTWEVFTGNEVEVYTGHQGYITSGLSFSKSGNFIVTGSLDRSIRLWDVNKGRLLRIFEHTGEVWGSQFILNDTKLISAEFTGEHAIRFWDVETGKKLCSLLGHKAEILDIDISPDDKIVASASGDNTVKLWDIESCKELKELRGHKQRVNSVSFSPDGKLIASGLDETIKLRILG